MPRCKFTGYHLVPYVFLKKNKQSIFANRFRLYKKKECERRRRYKVNKVKKDEQLQILHKKHRCSYCRGLYWSVYYYRGYMLCSFCFQKKHVLSYILFNNYNHDIGISDVLLNTPEFVRATTTTTTPSQQQQHLSPYSKRTDFDSPYQTHIHYTPTSAPPGRVFVKDLQDPKGYIEMDLHDYCSGTVTSHTEPNHPYLPWYDHEYWTYTGLRHFLTT